MSHVAGVHLAIRSRGHKRRGADIRTLYLLGKLLAVSLFDTLVNEPQLQL
jgi:hypothetical protein